MTSRFLNTKIKMGFSLTEVLLALVILGVIAAMTLPEIVNQSETIRHKNSWKKTFSTFAQATNFLLQNNGSTLTDVFSSSQDMMEKYTTYLLVSKTCANGASLGTCWHSNDGSSKYLNGGVITGWLAGPGVILNDGTLIQMGLDSGSCDYTTGSIQRCGYINVDVNGFAGPNIVGRDIFTINVRAGKISPTGADNDGNQNTCNTTNSGYGCSQTYLYD